MLKGRKRGRGGISSSSVLGEFLVVMVGLIALQGVISLSTTMLTPNPNS